LPLSVSTHAANHHEVRLVQLCFDFYMIEAKPENLIPGRPSQARAVPPPQPAAREVEADHQSSASQNQSRETFELENARLRSEATRQAKRGCEGPVQICWLG